MHQYPEPESSCLELKREVPANDQILKTAVGFCNQHGGQIVVGVTDMREVVGIDECEADRLLEFLHKTIHESCSPPIVPEVFTRRIGDRLVLVVKVSPGSQKPYFVRSLGVEQGTFVRLGRSTVRAGPEMVADLQRQTMGISFDMTPVFAAQPDVLDSDRIMAFLKSRTSGFSGHITDKHLDSYRLTVKEQCGVFPSVGGLLLFADNPQAWFPEAMIVCTRFAGVSGREALASRDFSGPVPEQYEQAHDFVLSLLSRAFTIKGKRRREAYDLPAEAVREALVNIVAHRNYAIPGPAKVAVYDDRVEFFSPGVFPGPIDTADLGAGITYIRNTVIARVLREAGYIEKMGTGFITMMESCAKAGLPPPAVHEGTNFVKCVLSRERPPVTGDTALEQAARTLFSAASQIRVTDVMRTFGLSRASAVRKLDALLRKGLITRIGAGAGTRYVRNRP